MVSMKKNPSFVSQWDKKSLPWDHHFVITNAKRLSLGWIFLSNAHDNSYDSAFFKDHLLSGELLKIWCHHFRYKFELKQYLVTLYDI